MSTDLIAQVEEQRHHVVVDSFTITWNELISQYKAGDVTINPSYQRAFRWSLEQQTKYVESLLLSIPTPPIFLSENSDGTFEVIDGLQRFSTIIKFFSAEIFEDEEPLDIKQKENPNNINLPTILTEAPILTGLIGHSRETLPETLLRTLRYSRVQLILLQKESSSLAKFNVFTRLNRAGTTLSNQEIRNCSARLFETDFPDILNTLATSEKIIKSLKLSREEKDSMGIQETILRLIAFGTLEPKTQKIEEFLDDVMYQAAQKKLPHQSKIQAKVIETFEIIYSAFPEGQAFRFYKSEKFSGSFSPNLYDIIACGVFNNLSKCRKRTPEQMRNLIISLHGEKEAIALTGAGSNARSKMIGRVTFGKKWFA
ncbi:DUF262 domain-containing protein [Pseudomonas syringae]|uniref:DUF262 domain-containing protein n=1 Tax=Pseudomonas syringae TaxID=317 RepID=UPI00061B022D|nr:DUF262 domain-containing protein [Pseudomonas syringae]